MKEHVQQPENTSRVIQSDLRTSKQAPISEILQAYKDGTLGGRLLQRESIEDEDLLQAKAAQQDHIKTVLQRYKDNVQRYVPEDEEKLIQGKFNTVQGLEKKADKIGEIIQLKIGKTASIGDFVRRRRDNSLWKIVNKYNRDDGVSYMVQQNELHSPLVFDSEDEDWELGGKRLLLGESDMSFSKALITKHPSKAWGLVSTTFESEEEAIKRDGIKEALLAKKVRVIHGVDATHLNKELLGTFDRIQFNFPRLHGSRGSSKSLIIEIARSAYNLLVMGGRLHLTIPTSSLAHRNISYGSAHTKTKDGTIDAIQQVGFELIGERKCPLKRYGGYGYTHNISGTTDSVGGLVGRELIFEKIDKDEDFTIDSEEWTDSERTEILSSDDE